VKNKEQKQNSSGKTDRREKAKREGTIESCLK